MSYWLGSNLLNLVVLHDFSQLLVGQPTHLPHSGIGKGENGGGGYGSNTTTNSDVITEIW
jgi:hypothetical protein